MNASPPAVVDVSALPSHAFGHRGLMWWGTVGVAVIEGTVFALTLVAYFYLWTLSDTWPMSVPPPDHLWGALNTVILLVSCLPNHYTKRAAERYDLAKVRIGMVVCLLFAIAFLVVRAFEFAALNCGWDSNAYGSVV